MNPTIIDIGASGSRVFASEMAESGFLVVFPIYPDFGHFLACSVRCKTISRYDLGMRVDR